MELSVLVQQTASNRFRAWCAAPVVAQAEGATRDEALANLQTEIGTQTRGAEVVRLSIPLSGPDTDPPGTFGDEQSNDPEAVAAWITAFDAIPPMQMTPAEEAAWRADRVSRKCADAAAFDRLAAAIPGITE